MPKLIMSCLVNQPVDVVYKAYIDPDNMLKWATDLVWFEHIKGEFGEIGSLAHLHYEQKRKKYILEDKLEYLDPGKKIVSQVSGEGLIIKVTTIFKQKNNETQIMLIWDGRGSNLIVKFFLPFMKGKIRKHAQAEIDTFKELVETYGKKFK